MNSAIQLSKDQINLEVSKTYSTITYTDGKYQDAVKAGQDAANTAESNAKTDTVNKLKSYSTTSEMNSAIQLAADNITSTVSKTYVTTSTYETGISDVKEDSTTKANNALKDAKADTESKLKSYSTTEEMKSAIKQSAESITSTVSKKVGTNEIISKINQSAESVTIKASKINFNGLVTANRYFKILTDGSFTCTKGTIGGFTVKGGSIFAKGTKLSAIGNGFKVDGGFKIYCGSDTFTDQTDTFQVFNLGHVTSGGHMVFASDGSTVAYLSSSSKRYKDHVADMTIAEAEKMLNVPVVWFKYKENYLSPDDWLNGKKLPGFYAEDVYDIFPEAAQLNEDGEPEDWNFRVIIPAMMKLIQELYSERRKME